MEEFNNNGEKIKDNSNTTNQFAAKTLDFLSGGGKMGELIRSKDWSKTALGTPDTWPQSLRTAVSICIASNFPICISWGVDRVQIYNDGYWPITGDMHPASMGQDFKECWHSAWPVIGQAFEEAFLGQARFLENQHIFLDRYGYKEETFFTFSFSPILDESGSVGGLFHPVIELTQQTLAERRLNVLRAVADSTVNARTVEEASSLILECLKDFELDIPFVLLYSIAADGKEATLQGSVGVEKNSPLAPAKINLQLQQSGSWPMTEAIENGKSVQVDELGKIFGTFHCGPYAEPPEQALVFPITLHGTAGNEYFMVVGVSSRRSLDEKYRMFYELLAASVTNTLTKARAYEEERKKAEALAEIDKAKTVFFSNISHEFRTPLTLMLSPLEELLNHKNNHFSESEKQHIETAQRNAMRLLKLVNTLLDFSRIESGRQQAVFNLVDIVALTKNLAANFRSVIEKAGLKLIVKADSIIQPVYVDRQMWEKIVFNLLSNAFKYTLKGSITVTLSAEEDFAVLKVTDTGVGIPENELPKMFERFHRVQNVTGRTYEGTGIGLSLIKELVQMHQGTINVESKLNEGSLFTVKIPTGKKHINEQQISNTAIDSDEISTNIYIEEIETLLVTEKPEPLKIAALTERNTLPTILVVDDNADMREHISSILSNNFNVITANNGMDALHRIKETVPTLVLSDIMMPVMDGIGLLKEIKSNKATANIPVIFLTARAGEESKIEGWETGADDYLVKPFSAKELLSRVKAQIKIVKLRQSLEGNVRNLFMEAPAAIGVLRGPHFVFELANDMYMNLTGNKDILGKPIREAFPELEGQGFFEILDTVYHTGVAFIGNEVSTILNKGNGKLEEVYFNFVNQPSHNYAGEIDGILVYGIDVTEQVLSRKKIEGSKKELQNIFLNAPAAIAIFEGPQHKYILANKAYEKLSNRKAADLLGKSMQVLFPELKGTDTLELFDKVLETGESFSAPEYALMLDLNNEAVLRQYYFNFSMEPLRNDWGEIYAVMAITYDITEQVIARKKIEENENQQAFLLKLSDALRPLHNPVDIEEAVTKIALDFMDADWCHYATIEEDNLIIQRGASQDDFPSLNGVYPISSYALFKTVLDKGHPFIVDDVYTTDILDDELKQLCIQLRNIAFINVPIIKNGKPVGMLSLVQSRPRKWTDQEVQLTIETAERTWAAVERAKAEQALRKSEEKYRTLFTSIDQGYALCELVRNKEGKGIDLYVLEVNPTYEKHTGVSMEMVLGKTILQVFPTMDKWWVETYAAVVDNQRPAVFEKCFEDTQRWFEINAYPGEKDKFTVLFRDITERKQSEEKIVNSEKALRASEKALKRSEKQLQNIFNTTTVAISVLEGPDYKYSLVNPVTCQITNRTKEELLGKTVKEVFPEVEAQGILKLYDEVYNTGKPFAMNELLIQMDLLNDGIVRPYFWDHSCNALRNSDDKIYALLLTAVNVTQQVEARKKIEESEQKIKLALEASNMGTFVWYPMEDRSEPDEGMLALFGVDKNTNLNLAEAMAKIIHPEDAPPYAEAVAKAMDKNGSGILREDFRIKHPDGSLHWISINGQTFFENGIAASMTGVAFDITKQKQAVEKIKESEARYKSLITAAPIAIGVFIGRDLVIENPNQQFIDIVGKVTDIAGKRLTDVMPELIEHGQPYLKILDDVFTTGKIYQSFADPVNILRNGVLHYGFYDISYVPLFNDEGNVYGIMDIAIDVTEQTQLNKKLRESETFNRTVLENSPDCIKMLDSEGRLQFMNTNGICLLEIDDFKSVENTYWWDMWEPHNHQIIKDAVATAKTGEKIQLQLFSPTAKGTPKWWDVIVLPVQEDGTNEKLHRILSVSRDITEQKQSELKEKELLARFQTLVLQAPVAICVLRGQDYVIEIINEGMFEMWDRTLEQTLNKPAFDVLPELIEQGFKELLDSVYKTGERFVTGELPINLRRKGKLENAFVKFVYEPLREADGTISGVMALAHEITEQVVARKKVEESEKKFRVLADSMPQHIWTSDTEGNLNYFNQSVYDFSGLSHEQINKDGWLQIVHPDDREENIRVWTESISTGKDFLLEHRFKRYDGEYRWQLSRAIPQLDVYGNIQMWVGTSTDIQDQKTFTNELERQVTERTQQIAHNNIELENMNNELQSFAYIASHDLQEPLRKIQIFSNQILEEEVNNISETGKDKFLRMQNSAKRMQTLIEDLLTYSRTATAERVFELGNFREIVEEVRIELQEELLQKNATVTMEADCDFMIIPFQFRQLINNLMSNSLKFAQVNQAPHISIKCTKATGATLKNEKLIADKFYWHIVFADNGIGFDEQYNQKIFEVFQRLHGRQEYKGTGIGLAIVKKIVENHSGIITARGEINKGATFDIFIPEQI